MTRTPIEAQFLKVGDHLASGGTVTTAPYSGLRTPSGKVDLGVNGILKTWNKRTPIVVVKSI